MEGSPDNLLSGCAQRARGRRKRAHLRDLPCSPFAFCPFPFALHHGTPPPPLFHRRRRGTKRHPRAERLHVSQPPLSPPDPRPRGRTRRGIVQTLGQVTRAHRGRQNLSHRGPRRPCSASTRRSRPCAWSRAATAAACASATRPSLTAEFLPRALRLFEAASPGVRVALHDLSSEECLQRVADGKLDLAITVPRRGLRDKSLKFEPLTPLRRLLRHRPRPPLRQKALRHARGNPPAKIDDLLARGLSRVPRLARHPVQGHQPLHGPRSTTASSASSPPSRPDAASPSSHRPSPASPARACASSPSAPRSTTSSSVFSPKSRPRRSPRNFALSSSRP